MPSVDRGIQEAAAKGVVVTVPDEYVGDLVPLMRVEKIKAEPAGAGGVRPTERADLPRRPCVAWSAGFTPRAAAFEGYGTGGSATLRGRPMGMADGPCRR